MAVTQGECKGGMGLNYKGEWGYQHNLRESSILNLQTVGGTMCIFWSSQVKAKLI